MPSDFYHPTKGHMSEYKWLRPQSLKIDPLYQRDLSQSRVAKIVQEWDYDLFNEPKVSLRADGSYYIFNGQHTVAAHKIKEGETAAIYCKIYRGLTWEQEKDLFVKQNGISKDPTTVEKLKAEYASPHSTVRKMVETCARHGVKVSFDRRVGSVVGGCNAVSALYAAWRSLELSQFERMIDLMMQTWLGDYMGLTQGFIKGFSLILQKFDGRFNDEDMKKCIGLYRPDYFIREARDIPTGSLSTKYATVILSVYNRGRRSRRLELAS